MPFPQESTLLLNNEKGSGLFVIPEPQKSAPHRAVMFGQVWSAQLVDSLLEVYSLEELFWFAREAAEQREPSDDGSGD